MALGGHTGGGAWVAGGGELGWGAVRAGRDRELPWYSIDKGELGVAVLVADLADPAAAALPFFESEGWATTPGRP